MKITWTAKQAREYAAKHKPRKYKNQPVMWHGIRFDSKIERDRFVWWRARPKCRWIDVHPKVLLDAKAGIYYRPDLCVWIERELGGPMACHFEDIKSPATIAKSDFVKNWKLFDAHHPAAPLWVVARAGPGLHSTWLVTRRGVNDALQI